MKGIVWTLGLAVLLAAAPASAQEVFLPLAGNLVCLLEKRFSEPDSILGRKNAYIRVVVEKGKRQMVVEFGDDYLDTGPRETWVERFTNGGEYLILISWSLDSDNWRVGQFMVWRENKYDDELGAAYTCSIFGELWTGACVPMP